MVARHPEQRFEVWGLRLGTFLELGALFGPRRITIENSEEPQTAFYPNGFAGGSAYFSVARTSRIGMEALWRTCEIVLP
jgi:hypothetical protein